MVKAQNKIIHRFIRPISDYEEGGEYYTQVIPLDTQAYALYPISGEKSGLYYVFGDGNHTYDEIRKGRGDLESAKEYAVFNENSGYTKEEIDQKLAAIHQFNIEVLSELPLIGNEYTLYLIEKEIYTSEYNKYNEYLWINNHFEQIGNSNVYASDVIYEKNNCNTVEEALDTLFFKTAEFVYDHSGIESATWLIEHNLNRIPKILILDSAGTQLEGSYKYINENVVRINFYSGTQINPDTGLIEQKPLPVKGVAYLS